jgi:hypothetical protein
MPKENNNYTLLYTREFYVKANAECLNSRACDFELAYVVGLLILVTSCPFSQLLVLLESCFLGPIREVLQPEYFQWLDNVRKVYFVETDLFLITCVNKSYR